MPLPIDVFSMADVQDGHLTRGVVDFVNNPVVSHAYPPALPPSELPDLSFLVEHAGVHVSCVKVDAAVILMGYVVESHQALSFRG